MLPVFYDNVSKFLGCLKIVRIVIVFLDKMSLPNGVDVSQLVQHPVLAALPPFFLRASERYQVQKLVCVLFFIKAYFRQLEME